MGSSAILSGALLLLLIAGLSRCRTGRTPATEKRANPDDGDREQSKYDLPSHEFIRRGMDAERVRSLVGEPDRIASKPGNMKAWYYPFGVVLVKRGTVRYKHPPSRTSRPEGDAD